MSEYVVCPHCHNPLSQNEWVKVVRCRDCKHFASDELGDCCTLLDFEDVKPMDRCFCSWGERRDDA